MRKNIFISAALAFMALTACQQENLDGNEPIVDGFRVYAEDTKAVLDGVKVVFEEGDAIDIYVDGAETPVVYTYDSASDLFKPNDVEANGEQYSVVFPSMTTPSHTTIAIPERQTMQGNSFAKNALFMAGTSTSKEVTLKHLMGLWEIDLLPSYDGQRLTRAYLTMNGNKKVWGNFTLDWNDMSLTYADGGNNKVTVADNPITLVDGVPLKLYFALPEGAYEGFTFQAVMTDNTTMEVVSPSTINIVKGQITKVKNDVNYRLFASGAGTEDDPYILKTVQHWTNLINASSQNSNWSGAYFKLASDINFGGKAVTPVNDFKGTIDGDDFTLSNAKIGDGTTSHQAFFYLLKGTVKNLKFDNITVTGGNASTAASSAAVITAGNSSVAFTIENCHVSNSTVISGPDDEGDGGKYAAGLVGRCDNADAVIRNCSVTNSTIKATVANAGGVVGFIGKGILDGILSSGNNVSVENSRNVGGVVGEMANATIINAVSQNNTCIVGTVSCGGVVGTCTGTTAAIINVLSEGNAVKSTSHQAVYYLGGLIGGAGKNYTVATISNCLVLSGTADYEYDSTKDSTKPIAGCVGIALGYNWNKDGVYEYIVSNSIIHQAYRTKYDLVWLSNDATKEFRRDAIGVQQSAYTKESHGGTRGNFTRYLGTPLTDGTALNMLNQWINENKSTYPTLKSWAARTTGNAFPEIVLEETAASGVNSLNIIESNY